MGRISQSLECVVARGGVSPISAGKAKSRRVLQLCRGCAEVLQQVIACSQLQPAWNPWSWLQLPFLCVFQEQESHQEQTCIAYCILFAPIFLSLPCQLPGKGGRFSCRRRSVVPAMQSARRDFKPCAQLLHHQCSVDWDKGFLLGRRCKSDTFITGRAGSTCVAFQQGRTQEEGGRWVSSLVFQR